MVHFFSLLFVKGVFYLLVCINANALVMLKLNIKIWLLHICIFFFFNLICCVHSISDMKSFLQLASQKDNGCQSWERV